MAVQLYVEDGLKKGAAFELGPEQTHYLVHVKRLEAHAIEAAEQTERLSIPKIDEAKPLSQALKHWPKGRRLLLCDETGTGPPILEVLAQTGPGAWALLTGPEGGLRAQQT